MSGWVAFGLVLAASALLSLSTAAWALVAVLHAIHTALLDLRPRGGAR